MDASSLLSIENNRGSGIYLKSRQLHREAGADITVTHNSAEILKYGGGVNSHGNMSLPEGTVLYNNHAALAGDDIYDGRGRQHQLRP